MAEATCEQRIGEYYAGRKADINELLHKLSDPDVSDNERDQASDELYQMPLAVEVVRVVKITIGTGGPGDWFEATVDDDGAIGRIEYHFNDWFDHAAINVSDDDDARLFCEQFTEAALA